MTADPLDAVIDRIRRSAPPTDGWPRARRRAARRRRLPALALAAAVAAVFAGWLAAPQAPPGLRGGRAPEVADAAGGPAPAAPAPPRALPPDKDGAAPAGAWPAPRVAAAAAAPVLATTGGAAPMKLGHAVPAGVVGERLHVWNWEKSPDSRVLPVTPAGAFALTPDGTTVVTAGGQVVDAATGGVAEPAWWAARKLRPTRLAFSPDGKTLLMFEHDQKVGTARLIDYPAGTERATVGGLWWATWSFEFSADGKVLALFGSDAHLRTFDAATGAETAKLAPPFANTIQAVAVSPDGTRVAGSYRGAVRVWDAATGKLVCEPDSKALGSDPEFRALAFSPDGKRLAGAGPGPLVLWDAADGKVVHLFPRESQLAAHVRFDAAGTTLTTVTEYHGRGRPGGREEGVYPTVRTWRIGNAP